MRSEAVRGDDEKLAVTVPQAADLVEVSRSTGYQLVASGEWPAIKIGRAVRVPLQGLRAWLERRLRATAPRQTADQPEPTED